MMSLRLVGNKSALLSTTAKALGSRQVASSLASGRRISSSSIPRKQNKDEKELSKLREENESLRRTLQALQSTHQQATTSREAMAQKPKTETQSPQRQESQQGDFGDSLMDSMDKAVDSAFQPFSSLFRGSPMEEVMREAERPLRSFNKLFSGMDAKVRKEAEKEINRVRDAAAGLIRSDERATAELGSDLELGQPFAQSFSSSSVNGETNKEIILQMPICGKKASGATAVEAHINNKEELVISRCAVQLHGKSLYIEGEQGKQGGKQANPGKS